jgi:hypothetical protein
VYVLVCGHIWFYLVFLVILPLFIWPWTVCSEFIKLQCTRQPSPQKRLFWYQLKVWVPKTIPKVGNLLDELIEVIVILIVTVCYRKQVRLKSTERRECMRQKRSPNMGNYRCPLSMESQTMLPPLGHNCQGAHRRLPSVESPMSLCHPEALL